MGNELPDSQQPQFEVRAIGSFKQNRGCPEIVHTAMSAEDISRLCLNECYNPSNERHKIDRIEIIKITPTTDLDSISQNIQDPWKVFISKDIGEGCFVNFTDEGYSLVTCMLMCPSGSINELKDQIQEFGEEIIPNVKTVTPKGEWKPLK